MSDDVQGHTILVVDDNNAVRQTVVRQLQRLQYRILEATDGNTALEMLESNAVDLMFSDIVMPGGMNGFELAKVARSRWPGLKVVLTSGFNDAKPEVSGDLRLPVIGKPYRREELALVLTQTLNGEEAP